MVTVHWALQNYIHIRHIPFFQIPLPFLVGNRPEDPTMTAYLLGEWEPKTAPRFDRSSSWACSRCHGKEQFRCCGLLPNYLSIYLPIYLSTYLSIYLPIYLFIYLSIYLPIYLSIYLPIYLSIDRSIYLSIDRSIYLSIDRSIYISIYLSIYLSTYL